MDDRIIWFVTGSIIGAGIILFLAPLVIDRLRLSRIRMSLIAAAGTAMIIGGVQLGLKLWPL